MLIVSFSEGEKTSVQGPHPTKNLKPTRQKVWELNLGHKCGSQVVSRQLPIVHAKQEKYSPAGVCYNLWNRCLKENPPPPLPSLPPLPPPPSSNCVKLERVDCNVCIKATIS